ncbi:polyhydroxyalkanoate synthesis repressor PhaR [soil metagenome]
MADSAGDPPQVSGGAAGDKPDRIVIKKYANRRLYNTGASAYVTLDHLAELVRKGADFVVFDAKSGDDITRQVLTQIIFDEETRGQNLLPIQFLRQLIKMYGDQMQTIMAPAYLEASLDAFARQQEAFREQFTKLAAAPKIPGGKNPFEEQVRANMALFDHALKLFNPYAAVVPGAAPKPAASPAPTDEMGEMKKRMEEMQRQIERLAKG